jgi:hypothetical protein
MIFQSVTPNLNNLKVTLFLPIGRYVDNTIVKLQISADRKELISVIKINMYKQHELVMLPTKEKHINSIVIDSFRTIKPNMFLVTSTECYRHEDYNAYHLYILSDDKIEIDDWVVCSDHNNSYRIIGKVSHVGSQLNFKNTIQINGNKDLHIDRHVLTYCKKIIATTDTAIKFPERFPSFVTLPQIPKYFIEYFIIHYNGGNIITKVDVEYWDGTHENEYDNSIKINSDNTININIKLVKNEYLRAEVEALISLAWATASAYGENTNDADCKDWMNHNL